MMKSSYTRLTMLALLVFSFLLTNSCKKTVSRDINPEFARYIAAFTYGNISSTSSIQIELTQDVPSVELNKEIDSELFEFSPSIKGKAYWTGSRNIKFVPDPGELKSGVEYKAVFKLDKVIKVEKEFKEFNFFFKIPGQNFSAEVTPYSPTRDNDLTWNSVQGTLKLVDEAPIDKVAQMFSMSGTSSKIKVIPTEVKGRYTFVIDSLQRTNNDVEYKLNIKGSPIDSKRDTTIVIKIPAFSKNTFTIVDVQTVYDPQECIRITFSDPLSPGQNIQGLISPNGIKNFSYDIKKNVLKLFLESSESNESVNLKIYKELKSQEGKPLDRDYTYQLSLRKNKPEVKILNSGNILPNSSSLNIPFQAVNLWAVDVKVVKIFENNILGYLQTNNFGENNELRRFGRLILKKRVRLDEDPSMRLEQWNTFNLDLAKLFKQDPGAIYRIQFSIRQEYSLYPCAGMIPQIPSDANLERFDEITPEEEEEWDRPRPYYYDSYDYDEDYNWDEIEDPCKSSYYADKKADCLVMASNVGIIAKMGSDKKVQVAVTNILTTEPMSGANIDVYNYQMQRIGSGKTDGDGFASIEYKGGAPFAIIASKDKEKGYLKVTSNLSLSLSNFDISGKEIQKGLKGYIYGERGVWRPGDSIYLTFILDDKDKTLPKNHPVSLDLYTPTGQLYQKLVQTSSVGGFYPFKLATDPSAQTGNWSAVIKVGGTSFRKTIKIETIKPNRLKVRLNVGEFLDASKNSIVTSLSSQWLHGAPASNLKANVEMTLSTASNPFKGYESYSFNNPTNKFSTDTYTIFDGRLDGSGNATFTAKLPPAANAPGMLRANIISRVFESGGDASFYTQTVAYSPYSYYVGVKTQAEDDYTMLETDKANPIDIVTLTPDGQLANRIDVNVKIYKIDWAWWWSNNYEDLSSYVNNTSTKIVLDKTVSTSGGKARVNFQVNYPEYGRYLVMVKDSKGGHTTGKIIYVDWPSSRGRSNKQDPNGLTMLSFSTDKKKYNAGENATVIIPKSSDGRVLISIENGYKIIQKEWVKTSAKEDTRYTFPITDEMTPNFYIFATMLQPHSQTVNGLPIRLYGVQNVNVENKNTVLQPIITMPEELRPEKEFTVSVSEKNRKKMTYTLAIVDEGLLDLTSFKTPNAWTDFYSRQSLGVRTWDLFDMVVGANAGKMGPLLSIGGDEALKPSNNQFNRFKPVVKYIGPFTANAGETQSHKITLPNYIGSVRVMVVAGSEDGAYGNVEKTVPVNNPLMVLSTLPRVAGPDEDILFPVNVFVTKDHIKNVTVSIQTGGLLQPVDGTSQTVSFSGKGDKIVNFRLKAGKRTGFEKITVKATGSGEISTETIDIEVRNPNPPVLLTSQALVAAGQSQELQIAMESPQPTDWVRLEVSRMPAVDLSKNLAYLLDYPHGCTEQVTSRAFPTLFASTFTNFSQEQNDRMKANVNEAIRVISARQLSDGGIAYWPGNMQPMEWVTTYAGHFLIEAQRMGYNVPASVIDKWKQFQKKTAQNWNRADIYNSYYSYSMTDLQQAYRLYSLALAGEPELGAMNRLKEMSNLSVQARWRLAAAYAVAGKKDAANQLIANTTDVVGAYSINNNTFGDPDRDRAMIMETYLLLGKTDKALALASKVSESLSSYYISTQTAAFGLVAMSQLAEKMGSGIIAYDWQLNGVKQKTINTGQIFQEIVIKPSENINISFTNKGQGQLFVRLTGYTRPLVDNTPPTAQGTGINLYVKYLDQNGKELNVSSLKQGTEFYASVIVQNTSGEYFTDLALSQVFASGWEIFNERLFSNGSGGQASSFNYQDIRDDRVYTYFNLSNGYSSSFRVRLQAAYCGRYYLPAVSCEAMYKPQQQGRTQGRWVEVIQ
ncbi:MAG: alpha-2-macroglobulin family protein [Dysgonomonas sp.]